MELTIDLLLEPVPQGRPRVTYRNGRVWTFYSDAVVAAKEAIRAQVLKYQDYFPKHLPLMLTVTTYRHRSPYLPKREVLPFRRADLDNEVKLIIDAMNGVVFPDDAAITTIIASKRYTDFPSNNGHIRVNLTEDIP